MRRKILVILAMTLGALCTYAENNFYVILKDGSANSYPLDNVDSLSFDVPDGSKVVGLSDLLKKYEELESRVAYLEANCCKDSNRPSPALMWAKDTVTIEEMKAFTDGVETVDMGGNVLWATKNVGANESYEFGDYFAWGEPLTKEIYSNETCVTNYKNRDTLLKMGYVDTTYNLVAKYDVATVNWGEQYRMPTYEDIEQLDKNSEVKFYVIVDEKNGKEYRGNLIKSKITGNLIFMPEVGKKINDSVCNENDGYADYLSSTCYDKDGVSCFIYHSWPGDFWTSFEFRWVGYAVRPVAVK